MSSKLKTNFPFVILLATTFLPVNDTFNILKILIVSLLIISTKHPSDLSLAAIRWKNIIWMWLLSIIVATFSVFIFERHFNTGLLFHEIARIAYYGLVMFLCSKLRISLRFMFYCCAVVLSIHFLIQITQYYRLGVFDPYIVKYYLSGNANNIHYQLATQYYYEFRSGSIFINPNVYVCYPYLSLSVFLEYWRRTKSIVPKLMSLVAFLSVVLTGSRMGLGSCILIFGWFYFYGNEEKARNNANIVLSLLVGLVIVAFIASNWHDINSSASDFRAFNLREAYAGSGSAKLGGFLAYLTHCNPIYWITGSLGSNELNIQFDMELGYVFAWFGILGVVWYKKLIQTVYHNNRQDFKVLSTVATISILLTAIGATSILNMSVFPYICAISLTSVATSNTP